MILPWSAVSACCLLILGTRGARGCVNFGRLRIFYGLAKSCSKRTSRSSWPGNLDWKMCRRCLVLEHRISEFAARCAILHSQALTTVVER